MKRAILLIISSLLFMVFASGCAIVVPRPHPYYGYVHYDNDCDRFGYHAGDRDGDHDRGRFHRW